MYRYTTPTIPITIGDVDFSTVDYFRIAFTKNNTLIVFVVPANDARVDAAHHTINIELSQEQTAEFSEGYAIVQARIKYSNGNVQATGKAKVTIEDVIDKVVI